MTIISLIIRRKLKLSSIFLIYRIIRQMHEQIVQIVVIFPNWGEFFSCETRHPLLVEKNLQRFATRDEDVQTDVEFEVFQQKWFAQVFLDNHRVLV